jgi:hypothetical protein
VTPVNMLLTVVLALITSAGFWAVLQLVITRKGRTAEIARQQAETEKVKQEAASGDINRQKLISEVTDAALRTADSRYAHLHDDYEELKTQSKEQRVVIVTLVDVLDHLVFKMRAAADATDQISLCVSSQEFLTARAALQEARTHLR